MSNTKSSLTQQNTNTYPSNTSGSITANAVKSFNNNFINAVATLGDTNVFTEPQTFGNTVQVNSDITANNVYAGNIPYLSGSNTFTGPTNTFSGSVNIQTASIQFLTVDVIVSSSTINNSGSNQLGDSAADTQTLWGTVNLPSGPLKITGSVSSTNGFTGSLQGTSSWANNATTASHALTAVSSSFALNATSASYALSSSQAANATSASYALNSTSASYALSSSNASTASSADDFTVRGELFANELNTISSTVNASTRSVIINGGNNTITSASLSSIFNSTDSQILGKGITDNFESNNNTIIGGKTSVISGSNQSTILGGSVRMNNVTASVALARDTAYTASANYTLFTQNIQSSGSVIITGSLLVTDGITGSLQGTASYAVQALTASFALNGGGGSTDTGSLLTTASVSLNTITFTKGNGSTFPITVDTGSGGGGGGMNLGANTFTGSQTIQSQSLLLQASSSVALNTNFFTASTAGEVAGANIYMFLGSANSGSVAITGSRNIGTVAQLTNTLVSGRFGGFSGSGNFGTFANTYSTASRAPILTQNNQIGAVAFLIPNTTASATLSSNYIGGAITITGSSVLANNITQNSIDNVTIENNFSGSGASQNITVSNNIIKGNTGTGVALIKFGSTTINTNARQFSNNLVVGTNITASLEQLNGTGHLSNTAIIGSGLIVSGTMPQSVSGNQLSASMFVGQFNETGSLADPSQIKFAVGAGLTSATRKTPFYVSQSGAVVIDADGGGENGRVNSVFGVNFVKLGQNTVNANTTVAAFNGSFMTNGGSIANGEGNVMIGGGANTITNGRDTAMLGSSYSTINTLSGGAESHNVIVGAQSSVISGSRSRFTGVYSSNISSISESINSAIIAGNSTSLNDTTSSVALGRDTAYTGSASYTLYTQNINASGSVSVTGSATITGDVKFASGSNTTMGTAVLDGANPGTVTVSNSLVTANSLIFLTKQTLNHTNGYVAISSKGSSTFTITSNHNGDTDVVAYQIINPA